jgi:uncharacterized protein
MISRVHLRLLLPLVLILGALAASAEKIADIRASGYVNDLAGVMSAPTAARLNALCAEVERKTGAQVAVVTVRSLEGQPVEDYAVGLFQHLGVGHKDNRGVLLLLAPRDRRYRIEVGYGLEPVINDARAGDVGRAMLSALRASDYSGAIEIGVNSLAQMIATASHVTLQVQPVRVAPRRPAEPSFPWWIILPFGAFALPFILRALRPGTVASRRRAAGTGIWWIGPGGFGGGWGGGGGGFGGFGGGMSGGGGASGSW